VSLPAHSWALYQPRQLLLLILKDEETLYHRKKDASTVQCLSDELPRKCRLRQMLKLDLVGDVSYSKNTDM
jgi:hypothetical protein